MTADKSNKDINLLKDFIGISHWQSLIAIIIFFSLIFIFSRFIKKTKIAFPIRIFIGLGIGLVFGLAIQIITGFSSHDLINPFNKDKLPNPYYIEWLAQLANWASLLKNIFITGVAMLTIPIVFLAIARVTSRKNQQDKKIFQLSLSGIAILLINVMVAFVIAFGLGILFKIGDNFDLSGSGEYDQTAAKNIIDIITSYIPKSFFGAFTQFLIIPVIVLGALIGFAIKKLTKHNLEAMDKARNALEIMWKIIISILTFFIKIMPFAVLSMLATVIIKQPIGDLKTIGLIIGVGYLALILTFCWHLLTLFLFGIKPWVWVKKVQRSLISGLTTQSSNAVLPIAMDNLKQDLKIDESASDTVMPLSTTIGLSGCAGVQSGLILSFLWFAIISKGDFSNWTISLLCINGLIVTLVASLGIAGVPGTASVVTAGVLGGLGFGAFYLPVYSIIGALDGLLDMGRTAVNISGGLQSTTIVGRNHQLIAEEQIQNQKYPLKHVVSRISYWNILWTIKQKYIKTVNQEKMNYKKNLKLLKKNKFSKDDLKTNLNLAITNAKKLKISEIEKLANLKRNYLNQLAKIKQSFNIRKKEIWANNEQKTKYQLLKNQTNQQYYELEKSFYHEINQISK